MARQGLIIALVVFIADQLSKYFMLAVVNIDERPPITLTPFLDIVMVWNRGVSFGMFAGNAPGQALFLILLAVVIVAFLVTWLARGPGWLASRGIGLVIGGALGNVADRMLHGAVADFFYFHLGPYYWPAFNVADAAICIGVALLCLDSMLSREKSPGK
jgi:lipoprotein signal peptidase